jgi:hypothetical protein
MKKKYYIFEMVKFEQETSLQLVKMKCTEYVKGPTICIRRPGTVDG